MEEKAKINYNNPEAITYVTEELGFTSSDAYASKYTQAPLVL